MAQIKVCGINDAAFAVEAARLGVDYLGLIFAEGSVRRVSPLKAAEIVKRVEEAAPGKGPRFAGVFTQPDAEGIARLAREVGFQVAQLHFAADAQTVRRLKDAGLEVWTLVDAADGRPPWSDAALLDGRRGAKSGAADWSLVAPLKAAGWRVVLAGGISEKNFADAVASGADIIDVNSSLETAPGVKSIEKLRAFCPYIAPKTASEPPPIH